MTFDKNVGPRDAQLRTILAVVVIVAALLFVENPWVKILLAIVAAILAATGYLHTCYLYKLLGKNTAKGHRAPSESPVVAQEETAHEETPSVESEKTV